MTFARVEVMWALALLAAVLGAYAGYSACNYIEVQPLEKRRLEAELRAVKRGIENATITREVASAQVTYLDQWRRERAAAESYRLRFMAALREGRRVPELHAQPGGPGPDRGRELEEHPGEDHRPLPELGLDTVDATFVGEKLEGALALCHNQLRLCAQVCQPR